MLLSRERDHPHSLPREYSLLVVIQRIRIRRVAVHTIVHDILALRDGIAPERLAFDAEVRDRAPERAPDGQRDRPPVPVDTRAVPVPGPPVLPVPDDPARVVCVDDEVAARDHEPGCLALGRWVSGERLI